MPTCSRPLRRSSLGKIAPQKSSGRSYFLTALLREVVFPEQRLAGANVKLERRRHALRMAGVAAMTLVTLALLAGWGYSTLQNVNYLKSVEARVEPARQNLAALPSRVQNLVEVAPVLQGLRDIWKTDKISFGVGSDITFYSKPAILDQLYGNNPVGWKLFFRVRPGQMDMSSMH